MRVLVACEFSGVVREAFRARGHDAWSCDLLPALDDSKFHIQMDVYEFLLAHEEHNPHFDLIIAHPPCTYLSVSGNRYYANRPDLYLPAADFATSFFEFADKVAVENPIGRLSRIFRKPSQIIQPYEFGDDASKRTCLWLQNLPPLSKELHRRVAGRRVEWPPNSGRMVERWSNQTDSGQNRLGPSDDRSNLRSITYKGIAEAMAEQWG